MCGMSGVLKRVFGYTRHVRSDKREFKESFSNMSAPMISRENATCVILPISSLLAMLDTIPVLKKLPLKRVFGYTWHMRSVKESLKRVFNYLRHTWSDKREFRESFSNMSTPMILPENARCAIFPILSLLAMLDIIPVLKKLPFNTFSRQGKHREFCCNTGKFFETKGKYF